MRTIFQVCYLPKHMLKVKWKKENKKEVKKTKRDEKETKGSGIKETKEMAKWNERDKRGEMRQNGTEIK